MASRERIQSQFEQYIKALGTLEKAIQLVEKDDRSDEESYKLLRDGAIQRFEYTYEIVWKLIKYIAEYKGYMCNSPRDSFKTGYKIELISELYEQDFLDMIEKRNLTTHIYHEETAIEIYEFIKNKALIAFNDIKQKIKEC